MRIHILNYVMWERSRVAVEEKPLRTLTLAPITGCRSGDLIENTEKCSDLLKKKNRRDWTNSCTSRVFIFSLLILIQRQASANLRCQASFWLGLNSPRCDMLHLHHPMHQVSSGCYTVICYTSTPSASQCSVAATPLPARDATPLHTECSALQPVCDAAGKA